MLERATGPVDELEELRRPWVDAIRIRCASCGEEVERIAEVGDVWLDAGIVPFSTLGWESPEYVREGYATGAARGLTRADLPDHASWEEWFPADWVSEMREQIRLWFYSQLFMSVALTGRAPFRKVLGYEKMLDETGREMHSSWGNTIDAPDAFARMGADVMRWQFCAQPPDRNLLFGFGPAHEIQRRLLTLWNSVTFLVQYGNVESFTPRYADLDGVEGDLAPLDRWLVERARRLVEEATGAYERWLTVEVINAFESFVDDLSNWYIRCSRQALLAGGRDRAPGAVARGRAVATRDRARIAVPQRAPLAGARPRAVRGRTRLGVPRRLARRGGARGGRPRRDGRRHAGSSTSGARRGRPRASSSGSRSRASSSRAPSPADELVAIVRDELRVKSVELGHVEAELVVKPNLPVLGPKLGQGLGAVRAALGAGEFEDLGGGRFRAAGHELSPDEVLVERSARDGWAIASSDGVTVALDTAVDEGLAREARVYELIHQVNTMRKEAGLALTDRIALDDPGVGRGPARARSLDRGGDARGVARRLGWRDRVRQGRLSDAATPAATAATAT